MILGKQSRLQRTVIANNIPFSRECSSHTPPAIVAKLKEYSGQAIVTTMMTGIEKMEATLKFEGSVAMVRQRLGEGYTSLIDIIVTDIGLIGDNGLRYAHTYIYAAKVASITPDTGDDGTEACEVKLTCHAYEFKMDGVTVDEIDSRTGAITLGGTVIVPAVI